MDMFLKKITGHSSFSDFQALRLQMCRFGDKRKILWLAVLLSLGCFLFYPQAVRAEAIKAEATGSVSAAPEGLTIVSRYARISYPSRSVLKRFNKELYVGGRLLSMVKRKPVKNIEEEVAAKIDAIVERAMAALDMYPPDLQFSITILPEVSHVKAVFRKIYNVDVDYIAFYSPHLNHAFYSAKNGRLRVVCHEIGHVVVENYFQVSPPQKIHEVMAQYVEKHIND